MGKVSLDMSMSLDGFISGPNGEDGGLHDWYFAPNENDTFVINELLQGIGAMIIGRKLLGDPPDGFDTPYKVPHFILTHQARPTVEKEGVPFVFVSDGMENALAQAQAAAGEKVVCVAGGAATAQQFLNNGYIDEIHIHLVSTFLGGGLRLFDNIPPMRLERTRVLESPGVTHLQFHIVK